MKKYYHSSIKLQVKVTGKLEEDVRYERQRKERYKFLYDQELDENRKLVKRNDFLEKMGGDLQAQLWTMNMTIQGQVKATNELIQLQRERDRK